jgi:small neutral amino acid transporter SnatA (MarC family)
MRPGLLDFIIDLVALLLGFAALLYGVWQVYRPAAWILGGLLLLGYAIQAARARSALPEPQ